MAGDAVVGRFTGTLAERKLAAARRDLEQVEIALKNNAETLKHHNEVKADFEKQRAEAVERIATREKELEEERAAAAKAEQDRAAAAAEAQKPKQ